MKKNTQLIILFFLFLFFSYSSGRELIIDTNTVKQNNIDSKLLEKNIIKTVEFTENKNEINENSNSNSNSIKLKIFFIIVGVLLPILALSYGL